MNEIQPGQELMNLSLGPDATTLQPLPLREKDLCID